MSSGRRKANWWEDAVFYEIAPLSFQDTDGDGKGDLKGIADRVDYLEWLGIDAVWLTPFFVSPMLDFGYDIADYCAVDPIFGNLEDFDRLLEALHRRDIKLILDFVPNHTSDQHPWFLDSRSSRGSGKRDWYVWADPSADGRPPNNWLSRFGGSAWRWDEATAQYYYHSFLQEQPDLNWRHPEVRAAMAEVMRFWMRRGVDGFRVDASAVLAEDLLLRDDPVDPEADESKPPPPQRLKRVFSDDRPESMVYLEEMRGVIEEFDARVLCGEVQGKIDRIGHFYGNRERPRLHLPLNFALLDSPWDAVSLQATIDAYLNAIPGDGWPNWVIGGHDKHRVASRTGQAQARILAMLFLTLRGTPFFFAGDELGAERGDVPKEAARDPFEKLIPGFDLNRDPERIPMRWDATENNGFTTGTPWLPMRGDASNVAELQRDDKSILHLYRELIALRKRTPALHCGDYAPLRSRNDILAYERFTETEKFTIALNLAHEPRCMPSIGAGKIVLSTMLDRTERSISEDWLRPDEGVVIKIR